MEFIKIRNNRSSDFDFSTEWRTVTSTYKKGVVYDQSKDMLHSPDMNWCAGAVAANVFQGMTGEIESGKAIYERAKTIGKKESNSLVGLSLPHSFNALANRQDLEDAELIKLNSLEQIMNWLITKGPVAFGGIWNLGMFNPKGYCRGKWMEYGGDNVGGHAATIIGTSAKGYIRIENSWGLNWGAKGTAWMKWEEFDKFIHSSKFSAFGLQSPSLNS